jgi:hypothetical protein
MTQGMNKIQGTEGHDLYIYNIGDTSMHIDDPSGTDILVLKQISAKEVTVAEQDGFLVVTYKERAIATIRGIDYIQTEDGCFRVEDWLGKQK